MSRLCRSLNKSSQIFLTAILFSIFLVWKWFNLNKGYEPASYLNSQNNDENKDAKTILLYSANMGDRENWKWSFPNRTIKCRNNVVCRVTSDHLKLNEASAVVIALSDINRFTWTWMPLKNKSPPWQKWVAFWGEAPWYFYDKTTFTDISVFGVLNGIFDWTVSYREDSTIISNYLHDDKHGSYCKYVKKKTPTKLDITAIMSKKSDLALWVVSHCKTSSKREKFIEILSEIMPVTSLGSCTDLGKDPSAFRMVDWYKFYMAFENSLCDDYITEKFFNMLKHNIVPVVLGAPKKDYEAIAPPNSFIHADDFITPEELAEYLKYLDNNQHEYLKYLEWKENYELVCDEIWTCKLCTKLYQQDNNTSKILDFPGFWNKTKCYGDWQHKTLSKQ